MSQQSELERPHPSFEGTASRAIPRPGMLGRAALEEFLQSEFEGLLRSLKAFLWARGHCHADIDDVIQKAHLAAFAEADKNGIGSIPAFYQAVVRNASSTLICRAARHRQKLGKQVDIESDHLSFDTRAERDEEALWEAIEEAVRRLPAHVKAVFYLFREGRSHAEIAERMRISERTSQRRLHRAIKLLRLKLLD